MMDSLVDTLNEDPRWETFGLAAYATVAAEQTLATLGLTPAGFEISVLGCSDARIAALNADFRGKAQPTNVLSWPAEDHAVAVAGARPALPHPGRVRLPAGLGDIAIAWETCAVEAADQGKSMPDHVTHLLVHATLHLLGYDHDRDADATLMEATETAILSRMGIADPYAVA